MKIMKFTPHTPSDVQSMLDVIGLRTIEDLLTDIPKDLLRTELNIPAGLSESELLKDIKNIASVNANLDEFSSYIGAGAYDHFIPSAVSHVTGRSEFYTAYTPYQPEASQGTLQAIYEYQSMLCALTGMDVANASLYDGATAVSDAALVALQSAPAKNEIVITETVHPEYRLVLKTYLAGTKVKIREIPYKDGVADLKHLRDNVSGNTVAVIVQNPNFLGSIEDMVQIESIVHGCGALFVAVVNPVSLGVLKAPGDYNADIAVGDGQPLGNPLAFGGPYLGFMAVKDTLKRKIPGRLVGVTQDHEGRRGFVLTLQAREQHIRREKATSNICSNEALNALTACVYLSLMGKQGMKELAVQNLEKSHYLFDKICTVPGFKPVFTAQFFNEFVIESAYPVKKVMQYLMENKVFGGLVLDKTYKGMKNTFLVCVTETKTKDELDAFVEFLQDISKKV